MPPTMSADVGDENSRKIGASAIADSRTPRRLSVVSADDEDDLERQLQPDPAGGRKLKMASPAAAIETVMVRT